MKNNSTNYEDKYGGLIKYLDLINFWNDLTSEERTKLRTAYTTGFKMKFKNEKDLKNRLDSSQVKVKDHNSTASSLLNNLAVNLFAEEEYNLIKKVSLESITRATDILEVYFAYKNLIKVCYEQKQQAEAVIDTCQQAINNCQEALNKDLTWEEKKQLLNKLKSLNQELDKGKS